MSLSLSINGTDRTGNVRIDTTSFDEQLNGQQSLDFEFLDTSGAIRPDLGQELIIYDNPRTFSASISASSTALTGSGFSIADIGRMITIPGAGSGGTLHTSKVFGYVNSTHLTLEHAAGTTVASVTTTISDRKFAGRITDYEESPFYADSGILMRMTVADYNEAATIELINVGFVGQTLKAAVTVCVSILASHGVRLDPNMATGPVLPDSEFAFPYIDAVFNRFSELTGWVWYIDNSNTLRWFAPGALSATTLDSTLPLEGTFKISKSWGDYRNVQWLQIGGSQQRDLPETFTGNGSVRSFQLTAVPVNNPPAGSVRVTRNPGAVITDYPLGVFGGPELWTYHDNGAGARTLDQNVSDPVLGASDTVALTYLAQYPIAIFKTNAGGISTYGARVRIDQAPDITGLDEGYAYIDALLRRYSTFIPRRLNFDTYSPNFLQGFLYDVNLPSRGISHVNFMVDQKTTQDDGTGTMKYSVGLIEGSEFQALWAEYFRGASSSGGAGSITTGSSPSIPGGGSSGNAVLRGFLGGMDGGFVFLTTAGTWYDINNRVDLSLQSTLFPSGSAFFVRVHVKLVGGTGTPHIQARLYNQSTATGAGTGTLLANPLTYTYDGFFVTLNSTECIFNLQLQSDQSGIRGYVQFATIESR